MNENYTRSRPRLEDAKLKEDADSKHGFFLTGFQMTVCILCIVAALALKQFGGVYYTISKAYVKEALKNNLTSAEVTQTFHELRDKWFPDAAAVFSSGITSSSSSSSSSAKTNVKSGISSSTSSSKKSSSSSAESSKSSSSAAKSALSVTTSTTAMVANVVDCSFTGGKNSPTVSNLITQSSHLPPKTASFAPFVLSIKPVKPVQGRTTSTFGYRINPISKKYSFHSGLDIAAAEGTPIDAAYAGKVEKVGKSVYYGNYVTLNNGNGVKTFYGHCETVTVKQGETVKAGATIAKVGSTGMSTGYHLHFEIHVNNICVNPQWVI